MPVDTDDLRDASTSLLPTNSTGEIGAVDVRTIVELVADVIDDVETAEIAARSAAITAETNARNAQILAERTATVTLTGKTLNLGSNTLVATSAQIAAAVTDETGTGGLVFNNSPALTGTPTVPTAAPGTNTTQAASTAFVAAAVEVVSGRVTDIEDVLGVVPPDEDMGTAWAIVNADGVPYLEGDHLGRVWAAPLVLDPQSATTGPVPVISVADAAGTVVTAISADQTTGEVAMIRKGETLQVFTDDEWPNEYRFCITDENGDYELFSINKATGLTYFVPDATTSLLIAGIAAGGLSPAAITAALLPGNVGGGQRYSAGFARYWTDASGESRPVIGRAVAAPVWIEEGREALDFVLGTGDSTSQGSNGDVLRITGAPVPNTGLMLSTGIRGAGATVFDPALATDFAPAAEAVVGILGSTGWASYLQFIEAAQATGPRRVRVVHTAGMSGSRLDEQLEGGTYFENSIVAASRALALAVEYGRTMTCRAVWLRNGANDRSAARTLAAYKADLVAMQIRYTARLNVVFGTAGQIDLMQSQLAGAANIATSPGKDASQIAQAQLEAALENANIFVTVPEYIFAMNAGNTVHGNALKYDLMGEYNAKADSRRRLGATRFCPMVNLAGITVLGAVVTVPFNLVAVPGTAGAWYGLQFSTAFRATRAMQGFAATGTRTVSSVAITDTGAATGVGIVQVTLSGAPAGGDAIEYAYTGATSGVETDYPAAWGNLMDTDPAASRTAPGVTLLNPAASFRKVIA